MFKKIFNKEKTEVNSVSSDNETNAFEETFEELVSSSIKKIGIKDDCTFMQNTQWNEENEDNHLKLLNELNYNDLFDSVVLSELKNYQKVAYNPSKVEFIKNYFSIFHHSKIAEFTPEFIQTRNTKLISAYKFIIECINRIQGLMDKDKVRYKIESDYCNSPTHLSTIYQCTTPFCIVSLGCDQIGRYSIVYTLDYRIKEIIGADFASKLIRRIYEFTPGEMEPFVNFNSLNGDCISTFEETFQLAKIEKNHIVTQKDRFEENSNSDPLMM
ncbi:hypothetical protein KBJ98_13605 [Flavobacterium sp. F-328]|uniref:Uncharacterized protein n=1 Tax=Flavobacterium erciyesense TaxID=2825842 RepID=A0ABS5D6U1_9FLAO|nr:hypothetical protein [Flavobacterium erciyesense]MBQ0909744.1 hypothetical protein [Flavobacterium erciyesense]